MTDEGVPPDVFTYSTLINLSPDLATAEVWFKRMTDEGVPPDVVTYSTLINLSPDLATAEVWFKRMTDEGILVTETITSRLATKIQTLNDANKLTSTLQEADAFVGQAYYSAVYARIACHLSGSELLNWHFQQKHQWTPALESAIKAYSKLGSIEDSCRIALAYPYLASARRVFRCHGDAAAIYYAGLIQADFELYNATYALGICFMENNRDYEALQMFKEALNLATVEKRKQDIGKRISDIKARSSNL
jgi:tetratricopeptide (TPR) repeat protein